MHCSTCNDTGELEWCFCSPGEERPAGSLSYHDGDMGHRHPRNYRACPDCNQPPSRLLYERARDVALLEKRLKTVQEGLTRLQSLQPTKREYQDSVRWEMEDPT